MKSTNKFTICIEDAKAVITRMFNDKRQLGRTILILIILILALVIRLNNLNGDKSNGEIDLSEKTEQIETEMYVDISGEVNKPGVYMVNDGTRLYEVISKAGGLTEQANTDQINQAGYVEDGEKIIIPSINDESNLYTESENADINSNSSASNGLVNINTAGKDELMSITGVGDVIAERIIEYRKTNRFKSIEDIMNVNGIGNATYEKMKSQITV